MRDQTAQSADTQAMIQRTKEKKERGGEGQRDDRKSEGERESERDLKGSMAVSRKRADDERRQLMRGNWKGED